MKCIKNGQNIKRVTNENAQELVKQGCWTFCSKSEWKVSVRDVNKKKAND